MREEKKRKKKKEKKDYDEDSLTALRPYARRYAIIAYKEGEGWG